MPSDHSIDQWIELLDSPYAKERAEAIRRLGESRRVNALEPLCSFLRRTTDKNHLGRAVKAIGKIGDRRVVPDLIDLHKEADPNLQRTIMKAFVRMGLFDDVLPSGRRERSAVERAIVLFSNREVITLIERDEITNDALRECLPPIF